MKYVHSFVVESSDHFTHMAILLAWRQSPVAPFTNMV